MKLKRANGIVLTVLEIIFTKVGVSFTLGVILLIADPFIIVTRARCRLGGEMDANRPRVHFHDLPWLRDIVLQHASQ